MHAIEFQAHIKNGSISIPEAYRSAVGGIVRVILLAQDHSEPTTDKISDLLENPLNIPHFAPLTREQAHDRG